MSWQADQGGIYSRRNNAHHWDRAVRSQTDKSAKVECPPSRVFLPMNDPDARALLREEDGVGAPDAALASRDERDTVPQFSRTDKLQIFFKKTLFRG
jgi:hypothetical protein